MRRLASSFARRATSLVAASPRAGGPAARACDRRAVASAARDRVWLSGCVFHAFHGVERFERDVGQRFEVDVEATADLRAAGESDDLRHTVNYAEVYQLVKARVEGPPVDLIEHVAEGIAADVLAGFSGVHVVRVAVRKPQVQVGGLLAHAGVEITRER